MKTTSTNVKTLFKAFVFLVVLGLSKSYAQAPFQGGTTYWVNGTGSDLVSPKDTFQNLMGFYGGGAYGTTTGVLNALTVNGVDPATTGTINIVLTTGYTGSEATGISVGDPIVGGYNFMGSARPVSLTAAAGLVFNITTTATLAANASLFRFNGVQYFTIDGQSVATQRNITFSMNAASSATTNRVIDFVAVGQNPCKNITVRWCNVIGNSTTTVVNSFAGLYVGSGTATPGNSLLPAQNISIVNNDIRAVQYGVFARGNGSVVNAQDNGLTVTDNIIGGVFTTGSGQNITYVGGVANAAGIYLSSQKNANILRNTVRNSLATFSAFSGILMDVVAGTTAIDSNITINANKIYRLFATSGYAIGIRSNLGTHAQALNINLTNNTIAGVSSLVGGTSLSGLAYPIGISIEDNSVNAGINIYNNTVNMYGDSLTAGGISACLAFSANTTGGVNVRNNLFANRMGRIGTNVTTPSANYGIVINNATLVPFGTVSNNAFYVMNFTGTNSFIAYVRGKNRTTINETGQAWGVTTFPQFGNDTTMTLSNLSNIYNGGVSVGVTTDQTGAARSASTPSIGAFEFAGTASTVNSALVGGSTYPINGTNSLPVGASGAGSFATVADAINYLNSYGVSGAGNINLQLQTGYLGETRYIPAVINYSGALGTRTAVLGIASGSSFTISTPNTAYANFTGVIRLLGAKFFNINGEGTPGQTNITISTAALGTNINTYVVAVCATDTLPVTDVLIKNNILIGNSTTAVINSFAGIYSGYYLPASGSAANAVTGLNNTITLQYNNIQAVNYGIYTRGANLAGAQNKTWVIKGNTIGGTTNIGGATPTTFIGGLANAAGIFMSDLASSTIDSNIVRNTVKTFALNRGIELSNVSGTNSVDSALVISRNIITKIENSTAAGGGAYGVLINLGAATTRAITLSNNMISGITARGTASVNAVPSTTNAFGILVDASSNVANLGLNLYFNSIHLGPGGAPTLNSINQSNGASAAIMYSTFIQGGITQKNNIYSNTYGSTGTGRAYGMIVGAANNIFAASDNNNYYANATGSFNALAITNAAVNPVSYFTAAALAGYTLQDTSSFSALTPFTNDSNLFIPAASNATIFASGTTVAGITTDNLGATRSLTVPSVGAHEFVGTYADIVAPNVFDLTSITNCSNGPFSVVMRVIEKSTFNDTLYYTVNGGAAVALTAPVVAGSTRTFTIPVQAVNSAIGYRYAIKDVASNVAANPTSGQSFIYTNTNAFPISNGFDVTTQGWTATQLVGVGGWNLNSFGSPNLPALSPQTGIKAAMFPAATLAVGTTSRLSSPCLDFTTSRNPILRFWISQNADNSVALDAIDVKAIVNGVASASLKNVQRVNTNLATPGFTMFEVCLSAYIGQSSIKIALDAVAAGNGNNIVLDSIVILDDAQNLAVTPSGSNTVCLSATIPSLSIAGTNALYSYKFVNILTGLDFTTAQTGNGGALAFTNISNLALDSAYLRVRYTLTAPGCTALMLDTNKIYVRKFRNSPVLTNGATTTGTFTTGTALDPDILKPGDVMSYALNAPTQYTNAGYGTTWSVVNTSIKTANNTNATNVAFTAPSGSGAGAYTMTAATADNDSTFIMTATFRLLGTIANCDSVITRYIKVSRPNSTVQAPFAGGMTYVINGNGNDYVAPKDTFINLMGAYTGGAFGRTTGIFPALTINGVDATSSGQITILLAPGYNGIETSAISLGDATVGGYSFMSAIRPIVMKVAAGLNDTLTTTATIGNNASMITFNGVQYFTIDGSNNGSTSRNLTLLMPAASSSNLNRLMQFAGVGQNGCQYITVKNCIVTGQSTPTAVNTYAGFYLGGGTTPSNEGKRSQNITISNNYIQAVQYGVYARGIGGALASHDYNLSVVNNIIGGTTLPGGTANTTFIGGSLSGAGILISAQALANVSGNTIRNSMVGSALGGFRGIALTTDAGSLSLDSGCTINGNQIYNHSNTSTATTGTYGIRISLSNHSTPLLNTISNNTIGNITSSNAGNALSSFNYPIGILIEDNSANAGYNIYHNTINLYGDTLLNGGFSACVAMSASVTGGVNMVNNLFSNRMGRSLAANGVMSVNYGVVSMSTTVSPFTKVTSNAFYINNFRGSNSFIGYMNLKNRVSLREFNQAFGGANNISTIPSFIGVNDSTMVIADSTGSALSTAGEALAAVTKDINGKVRSSATPSIGAYEFYGDLTKANFPLWGGNVYDINGTNAWPTGGAGGPGSFATVADAMVYINNYGATGAGTVFLNINTGYAKENRFIPAIIEYPGTNAARTVQLGIASGYSDTLTTPAGLAYANHYALLRFIGTSNFNVDGRSKKLTFLVNSVSGTNNNTKVISLCGSDTTAITNVAVKNCILTGQSSTTAINTYAGIYHGFYTPTGATPSSSSAVGQNNNVTIDNNLIQAVRNGVYVRGANIAGVQNGNWKITNNVIGGTTANGGTLNTTYIGGNTSLADDQGGVVLKAVANSLVDGNTIRNTMALAASSSFKGIDLNTLTETNGVDSNITISKNIIYNLNAGTTGNTVTYGIRINLGANAQRAITIVNNSIAKIIGSGSGTNNSTANPMGIFMDAPSTVANLGVSIYFNTIQLTGNVLANGSSSSCILVNTSIGGGVSIQGNILSNTMGRLAGATGNVYGVFIGSGASAGSGPMAVPNGSCNFNAYFAGATGSTGYIGCSSNGATGYNSLAGWKTYTAQDVGSYFVPPAFYNDSLPNIDPSLSGAIFNGAATLPGITTDLYGNARSGSLTNIGAVQFTQNFTPLAGGGTYLINGVQNPPTSVTPNTGSFATINKAFQYINANGVDNFAAPVNGIKLMISTGYAGEGDTLITPLLDYPRMNPFRPITLTVDAGRNDTIRTTGVLNAYAANSSVLRFAGSSYFTIDGSNNGSTSRNLTIMLPAVANGTAVKVVDVTGQNLPTTNFTIKNCNIVGNSTNAAINTFAGIYGGGVLSTPSNNSLSGNNSNTYTNNYIVGVRNGIYLQGLSNASTGIGNQQDVGVTIKSNIIGGTTNIGGANNTDFFGGANNSAGIFLSAQNGATIDGNTVRNSLKGFAGCRGIELSNVSGQVSVDSNIVISNNIISKIENTTAGGAAYGILIGLGNTSTRNITVFNNMISAITAPGTNSTPNISLLNPYGILVDASGTINNYGLNLWHNSINMGLGSPLSVTNATSACLFLNSGIRGGVNSVNNIYQNTEGRPSGSGSAYAVLVGANLNVFTNSDNNNYFVNALNSSNYVAAINAAVSPVNYRTVDTLNRLTNQDTLSIGFVTPFTNDTNLFIPNATKSAIFGSGRVIAQVPFDISGNARSISQTVLGAHEYLGSYADSTAPKAFNVTPPQTCSNGPFTITMRVIERNVSSDTLYYSVNGGANTPLVGPTVNGFNRTFVIPVQAANSSITYNYVVRDGSTFGYSATNPASGVSYLSTIRSSYPLQYGFDLPNTQGWTVEQISGVGGWDLNSYGSGNLPILGAMTGNKAALFPSATLAGGTASRLVSPCLDMSLMKMPTLRFWMSQNADAATVRDSINVRVSAIPGVWSAPLKTTYRVNTTFAFPGYTMVEVCLSNYVGIVGLRVGLEAGCKGGGNNIVLDSIMIYDDLVNLPVSPKTYQACLYDSVSLNLPNSNSGYSYQFINMLNNGSGFGLARTGNGGTLNFKAVNQGLDSIYLQLKYTNINSGCNNIMADTEKIYIKKFSNGPFLIKGAPFSGNYSVGTQAQPDAAKFGDTMTYTFIPPSSLTNGQYGTDWTIVNQSIKSLFNAPPTSSVFTAPSGSGNGYYTLYPKSADGDSLYKLTVTFRLLPSGCDSTITRWIKVTSAPAVSFIAQGGTNTQCAKQSMTMTNTSTYSVSTAPVTVLWTFGDGQTATTSNAVHTYDTAGVYTVTLRITNNAGIASSTQQSVTIKDAPTPNFTFGNVCAGSPVTLTNGSVRADAYAWTFVLNGSTEGTSANQNPAYAFAVGDTAYTVTMTATNSTTGCASAIIKSVYSFPKPTASFSTSGHCLGTNVAITNNTIVNTNKPNSSFGSEWDFGNNGGKGLSNQPYYIYPASGTYSIKLKVTTNFGCKDSSTNLITVFDRPVPSFTVTNTCQYDAAVVTNNTTFSGGLNKVNYKWDFGDGSNSTSANPTKSYTITGNVLIKLIVQDTIHFCKDSMIRYAQVYTKPHSSFISDVSRGCQGQSVEFTNASGGNPGDTLTYLWDFGDGNTSNADSAKVHHVYNTSNNMYVVLKVTTQHLCSDTSGTHINISIAPVVNFSFVAGNSLTNVCKDSATKVFTPSPSNLNRYQWDFGDGTHANTTGVSVTNVYNYGHQWYHVTLVASDINNCAGTYTDSIFTSCSVGLLNATPAERLNLNISPNPFTHSTHVNYTLLDNSTVKIRVFDMLGRTVASYDLGEENAGTHKFEIDADKFNSSSSTYMVNIEIDGTVISQKIVQTK